MKPKKFKLSEDDLGEDDDEEEGSEGMPKAGAKRRKRYYAQELPKNLQLLQDPAQAAVQEIYLYQIVPILTEEILAEQNRKHYAIRR